MNKIFKILAIFTVCFSLYSEEKASPKNFKPFTGKVIGNKVRMRSGADLDSAIISQLNKDQLVLVLKDSNEFWGVKPASKNKGYVFRSYVIDNTVEADRVNIRLEPNVDAPIIGQLHSKDIVDGKMCPENNKWLEIDLPSDVCFYISKEYITYSGDVDLYVKTQIRQDEVEKLLNSAYFITQGECKKPYDEMNPDQAIEKFDEIIKHYPDFTAYVQQAKDGLALLQDNYLQKKIAYLEAKANISQVEKDELSKAVEKITVTKKNESITEKMKFWESVENSLYRTWTTFHPEKKQKDFYKEQEINSMMLSGIIESFTQKIKNKPGDYLVKSNNNSAYLYSTKVNLDEYVGKKVKLKVSPRPNNNFAFPAYFVNEVEVQ